MTDYQDIEFMRLIGLNLFVIDEYTTEAELDLCFGVPVHDDTFIAIRDTTVYGEFSGSAAYYPDEQVVEAYSAENLGDHCYGYTPKSLKGEFIPETWQDLGSYLINYQIRFF